MLDYFCFKEIIENKNTYHFVACWRLPSVVKVKVKSEDGMIGMPCVCRTAMRLFIRRVHIAKWGYQHDAWCASISKFCVINTMVRLNHLEIHEYVQHVIYFFLRLSNMQIWVWIYKFASLHHCSTPPCRNSGFECLFN